MSDTRDFPRPVGAYLLVQPTEFGDHLAVVAAGPSAAVRPGDVVFAMNYMFREHDGGRMYIHSDAVVAVVATAAPMSADEAWNHGKVPVAYGESPEVAARAFDGMWDEVVAIDDGDFMARFVAALRGEHPRLFRDNRPMAQQALDALESFENDAEEEAAWTAIRERHPSRFPTAFLHNDITAILRNVQEISDRLVEVTQGTQSRPVESAPMRDARNAGAHRVALELRDQAKRTAAACERVLAALDWTGP